MSPRTMMMALATMTTAAACVDEKIDSPIEYSQSGGFGGGTITTLRIERSGRYTQTDVGQAPVHGTIAAIDLVDLRAKIDDAALPSLDDSYNCSCADDIAETVSVEIDDQRHTVSADRTADKPGRLQALLDKLRSLLRPLGA
jgi:hypothetical protein